VILPIHAGWGSVMHLTNDMVDALIPILETFTKAHLRGAHG
jgi:hypothetical protein